MALAYELVALRQARELSSRTLTPALDAVIDTVSSRIEAVPCDRSLAPDVELARGLIRSGELTAVAVR